MDIVDPEIGSMALAAEQSGVHFGYLHLVSNNLVHPFASDLANERAQTSRSERNQAYVVLMSLLAQAIQDLATC